MPVLLALAIVVAAFCATVGSAPGLDELADDVDALKRRFQDVVLEDVGRQGVSISLYDCLR